jgi:hypothetical protein
MEQGKGGDELCVEGMLLGYSCPRDFVMLSLGAPLVEVDYPETLNRSLCNEVKESKPLGPETGVW